MNRYTDQSESYKGQSVKKLAIELLKSDIASCVFIPYRTGYSKIPMPSLISDSEKTDGIDPLAPCAPFNSAKQAASVLKYSMGKNIALFLRPCEIRALIELVKLNQCSLDDAIIISSDCYGRIENQKYLELLGGVDGEKDELTKDFYSSEELHKHTTVTCRSCTSFTPLNADIAINFMGTDTSVFTAQTDIGEEVLSKISGSIGGDLSIAKGGSIDDAKIAAIKEVRSKEKKALFSRTNDTIGNMDSFQKMIGSCLNCYNCRTACPVCYCKECVFLTDIFLHDSDILHQRSMKKGVLKLPPDTTMFHMTRLAHIGHSCVGCGQCTSVCPSNIQVADMFRTVSEKTQEKLGYKAGSDPSQPIPYLAYKEEKNNG
jgi:formate dehydrogenase subunit beta